MKMNSVFSFNGNKRKTSTLSFYPAIETGKFAHIDQAQLGSNGWSFDE